jgi:hypothetical protein
LLAYCDNTTEALAGMLGKGGTGSDTTADLLAAMDTAITAVPPKHRRLMATCDTAGASHGLITRPDELSARINHYPWLEPHKLVALEPPITPVRRAAAICWLRFLCIGCPAARLCHCGKTQARRIAYGLSTTTPSRATSRNTVGARITSEHTGQRISMCARNALNSATCRRSQSASCA